LVVRAEVQERLERRADDGQAILRVVQLVDAHDAPESRCGGCWRRGLSGHESVGQPRAAAKERPQPAEPGPS
jgi:hypothetical protein